jgi:hypothetical protein
MVTPTATPSPTPTAVPTATPTPSPTPTPTASLTTSPKQTEQHISYAQDGTIMINNSIKDDGFYQKGTKPDYIRVNDIVYDNLTHLQWQDNKNIKKRWLYDKFDALCQEGGSAEELCYVTYGDTAVTYCEKLNLGGFSDWRLPTLDELVNIVDRSKYAPAMNSIFKFVESDIYWTVDNVDYEEQYNSAWSVDFSSGDYSREFKIYLYNVRCVRGEK